MSNELKYIVIRIKYTGREEVKGKYTRSEPGMMQDFPIVFPKGLNHNNMADVTTSNRDIWDNDPEIIAAGFCYYDDHNRSWECHGHSESLKMDGHKNYKSRGKEDADLLNHWNRTHGITFDEQQ